MSGQSHVAAALPDLQLVAHCSWRAPEIGRRDDVEDHLRRSGDRARERTERRVRRPIPRSSVSAPRTTSTYDLAGPAGDVAPLLAAIDADPTGIFWG